MWEHLGWGQRSWGLTTESVLLLLVIWVSALKLVSLLLNAGRDLCVDKGCLHPCQRQGWIPAGSILSLYVCTLVNSASDLKGTMPEQKVLEQASNAGWDVCWGGPS